MGHLRLILWPALLALVTVAGSLWASCLMPFTALAVVAAATLPLRGAVLAVLGAWGVNQAIGFGLLGFGGSPEAVGQGLCLLAASLGALAAARGIGAASGGLPRLGGAFVAGFAIYEAFLYAAAHFTSGLETFTPAVVAQVALSEGLWFALLVALSLVVQRTSPALAPHRPLLRST